ncbi:uncharacterized protein EV422DRAFT_208843 [Fimicolochytrium jonesii]|uniref:uncharacterized protein n=1 Tax=Fimicolochytrium jonesii TaxID=1396493 RepID=UPI0022FEC4DA|nr:uncharacterized protein EV422DRAFT_208843 [Fimicolochytrium jonesii]KAI8817864.1 hypothetical protein EV422DRAFT_208843 [Fimicolochytrium jonesii]
MSDMTKDNYPRRGSNNNNIDIKYHLPSYADTAKRRPSDLLARRRSFSFASLTGSSRGFLNLFLFLNLGLWALAFILFDTGYISLGSPRRFRDAYYEDDESSTTPPTTIRTHNKIPVQLSGTWGSTTPPPLRCKSPAGSTQQHLPAGRHYLVDLHDVNPSALATLETLTSFSEIESYITEAGMTLLGSSSHKFECGGMTAVFLLSESHVSIHTWPENRFVALDVYTCGAGDPGNIVNRFEKLLQPGKTVKTYVERGTMHHVTKDTPTPQHIIADKSSSLSTSLTQVPQIVPPPTLGHARDFTLALSPPSVPYTAHLCINADTLTDDCTLLRHATILADVTSPYQRIEIVDTQSFGRCMLLDRVVQFCESDNHVYTEGMVGRVMKGYTGSGAPRRITPSTDMKKVKTIEAGKTTTVDGKVVEDDEDDEDDWAARHENKVPSEGLNIFMIGGGDGWVASHLLDNHTPLINRITLIDIDAHVTNLTRTFFAPAGASNSFTHPKVSWHHTDAAAYLTMHMDTLSSQFDIVLIDCTDNTAESAKVLYTAELYANVVKILKKGGKVVQQMNTDEEEYKGFMRGVERTWGAVGLGGVERWREWVPSFGGMSVFWMGEKV